MKDPRRKTQAFFLLPYHGNNPSYQPKINKTGQNPINMSHSKVHKQWISGWEKKHTDLKQFSQNNIHHLSRFFPPDKQHQTLPIRPSRSPRHVLAIGQLDGGGGKVHAVLLLEGDGVGILRNQGLQHEGTVEVGLVHVSPRRGDIPCKPKPNKN